MERRVHKINRGNIAWFKVVFSIYNQGWSKEIKAFSANDDIELNGKIDAYIVEKKSGCHGYGAEKVLVDEFERLRF